MGNDKVNPHSMAVSRTPELLSRSENKLNQKVTALQESEAKFRAYMENSPLGVFVTNMEGQYVEVNRAACQMSGYTEEELLNLSIPDFIAPEFLEKGMQVFERLLAEGYAEDDVMVIKKNGGAFWINLASVKIDINRVIAFCQDITLRKEKEEQAKELNCLNNFSLLLRKEKNNLEKILEDTVQLLPSSFQHPEDAAARIAFKGREFKTEGYEQTSWKIASPLKLYSKLIGIIEVCYHNSPHYGSDPFVKGEKMVLETIAEHLSRVIEQIETKECLQKSNNQLATTLHSIGDGVIVTDAGGKITRLNPRAEKLTGWIEKEALGRALTEVFHIINAKTGEAVPNPVYHVINTGTTQSLANDTILVARDGTEHHIADSAAPMIDNNKIFGVIMVFSDVTKRKKAEDFLIYKLGFEKMLADISSVFASKPSEQLEQSINYALAQIGEFFQIDRSYVIQFSEEGQHTSNTYEWCSDGTAAQMDQLQNIPVDAFPWSAEQIKNKKYVNIPNVDSLPPEAEADKKNYKSQDIRSLLSIPMMKNGIVYGFLGLDSVKEKKYGQKMM
ncbi:MAG: PAS domain S-box protein [Bacillota bacterium]|nr:PAS domain S-box protein [Bacillota bacterium]